jgi:hypothetical protein
VQWSKYLHQTERRHIPEVSIATAVEKLNHAILWSFMVEI